MFLPRLNEFEERAAETAGYALAGVTAAAALSVPLGSVGLVCGGVGSLVGQGVEWITQKILPEANFSEPMLSSVEVAIVLAAKFLSMVALTWLLAPLFGVQMTLMGATIFTSITQTMFTIIASPLEIGAMKSKSCLKECFNY